MPRVARWLGVREGEGRLLVLVASVFAATEAGRGFGEIGADTLFISRFGAGLLPWLFIGLGAASLVVSLAYGAALGRLSRGPLFAGVFLGAAGLLAVERLALAGGDVVLPALWLTVYAAGTVAVTVAWTLAGTVFDARQAKRLFPLCTSAAIAGSFGGTLAAGPLARALGTETLILAQAALFAFAAASLVAVVHRASGDRLRGAGLGERPIGASIGAELLAGWEHVRRSPLMRLVAVAYVLFSVLAFSVSYPFLVAMSEAFPAEADLATALGLLSAAVTGASFVVSLTVANRLFARLGVAGAALTLPVVYVAGFAAWLLNFSVVTATAFRFAQQVTQRGVSNAAWSAFYNVVPSERRAQVLAFNDGVPGQLGIALSGILLLAGASVLAADQIFWLGLATAVALTAVVVAIGRRYAASLVATLRSGLAERILEGGPGLAALTGGGVAADLTGALESPEAPVRRMAAELLGRLGAHEASDPLVAALRDPDAGVRASALGALAALAPSSPDGLVPETVSALLTDPDPVVRATAIRAVSRLDGTGAAVLRTADDLASDASASVRAELAIALRHAGEEGRPRALIEALLDSHKHDDRLHGLEAVAAVRSPWPGAVTSRLLHDPVPEVRAAAVRAVAATDDDGPDGSRSALLAALGDDALVVRRAAATTLRGRADAAMSVVERLETGSPREQQAALDALEGHGPAVRARVLAWATSQVDRARDLRRHAALSAASAEDAPIEAPSSGAGPTATDGDRGGACCGRYGARRTGGGRADPTLPSIGGSRERAGHRGTRLDRRPRRSAAPSCTCSKRT